MAWFKVDDSFYDHPKVFDAPDCAVALWVRAGSWASRNLTDGHVPAGMPRRLCDDPDTAVKELVKRGLWEHAGDGGYRFHDWAERQPSRTKVLAERGVNARRQALVRNPDLREFVRERDANLCRYCGRPVEWKDRRSSSGGTFDHVNPDGPTDADNVVVACRGCVVGKGSRTPEQAGMQVLSAPVRLGIQDVSRYELQSDLGSGRYPTRPDPTRPVLPKGSTNEGGEGRPEIVRADPAESPPPLRCQKHRDKTNPPPCGQCADARRTRKQWDADRADRAKADAARQKADQNRARLEARQAEITGCRLCDERGQLPNGRHCGHDPDLPERARRGRQRVESALRATKGVAS